MNPIGNFKKKTPAEQNKIYISVILICAFLAFLLGLTILSLSLSYPESRAKEDNSGTMADSAVREISAGLLVKSEDTLSSALSYAETYYTTTPADRRSELAAKRFAELFYGEMRELAGISVNAEESTSGSGDNKVVRVRVPDSELENSREEGRQTFADLLESLIRDDKKASVSVNGAAMYIAYSKTGHFVEIQNLKVKCGDGTTAKTNLRFTAPDRAAGDSVSSYAGAVNAYAVVADGDIISTGGRNRIYGSVYGGNSIQAQAGGNFDIDGDTTVTRGDIAASGSAMMNLLRGELWAENIKTVRSGSASGFYSSGVNMDIAANCFIEGDLILDNPGYSVYVSGNYYGYGINESNGNGGTESSASENTIDGTEMDSILERLMAGSYTIQTNEDGTTTTILSDEAKEAAEKEAARIASAAAMEAAGSSIRITGENASALLAYAKDQVLWLAATGYYDKASWSGRAEINASNVPNGLGSGKKDTGAANLDTLYTYQYNGLMAGLDKNAATSSPSYLMAEHLLDISGLTGKTVIYTENDQGVYEAHEIEPTKGASGDYIPIQPKSEYKTGVLIADCDVRLANTDFNGIIITTGDVVMTGGVVIRSDYAEARFTGVTESLENDEIEKGDSGGRVQVSLTESVPDRKSGKTGNSDKSEQQDQNQKEAAGNEAAADSDDQQNQNLQTA